MPAKSEYVAHGRSVEEIGEAIGADWLVYQDLQDLVKACLGDESEGPANFDCSCFDGVYVTGGITEEYLERIERLRNDAVKNKVQV
jgi:amidophosphoribosyltransferase